MDLEERIARAALVGDEVTMTREEVRDWHLPDRIQELEAELEEANDRYDDADRECDRLALRNDELEGQVEELTQERDQLQEELDTLRAAGTTQDGGA